MDKQLIGFYKNLEPSNKNIEQVKECMQDMMMTPTGRTELSKVFSDNSDNNLIESLKKNSDVQRILEDPEKVKGYINQLKLQKNVTQFYNEFAQAIRDCLKIKAFLIHV